MFALGLHQRSCNFLRMTDPEMAAIRAYIFSEADTQITRHWWTHRGDTSVSKPRNNPKFFHKHKHKYKHKSFVHLRRDKAEKRQRRAGRWRWRRRRESSYLLPEARYNYRLIRIDTLSEAVLMKVPIKRQLVHNSKACWYSLIYNNYL